MHKINNRKAANYFDSNPASTHQNNTLLNSKSNEQNFVFFSNRIEPVFPLFYDFLYDVRMVRFRFFRVLAGCFETTPVIARNGCGSA